VTPRERGSRAGVLWIAFFAAACSGAQARTPAPVETYGLHPHVVLFTSSAACPGGSSDIARHVGQKAVETEQALTSIDPEMVHLNDPTADDIEREIALPGGQPLFVVYLGHGCQSVDGANCDNERGPSGLCLRTDTASGSRSWLGVERLLDRVSNNRPWVVLVVDACSSADIDVQHAKVPSSVISASPWDVSAGSFSSLLGQALRAPVDRNCDGWFSDQELLEMLVDANEASVSRALVDEYAPDPKLRRQAWAELPLWRVAMAGCNPSREAAEARALANAIRETSPDLAGAIFQQLALGEGSSLRLPMLTHDFFVSKKSVPDWLQAELTNAGLAAFPGTLGQANLIGRFALFAHVYRLEWWEPYLSLTRVRDSQHHTLEIARHDVAEALGRSVTRNGWSTDAKLQLAARFTRFATAPLTLPSERLQHPTPAPCGLPSGQCFHEGKGTQPKDGTTSGVTP